MHKTEQRIRIINLALEQEEEVAVSAGPRTTVMVRNVEVEISLGTNDYGIIKCVRLHGYRKESRYKTPKTMRFYDGTAPEEFHQMIKEAMNAR